MYKMVFKNLLLISILFVAMNCMAGNTDLNPEANRKVVDNAPEWFKKAFDEQRIDGITGTPTFIVWDGERELARLKGYTGRSNFLADIHNFLASNEDKFGVLVYPDVTERGPMDDFGNAKLPPPGVINSRDLFKHMYKTPEEAVKASDWFGCHGTIHYHKDENVWMPCSMN